MLKIKSVNWSLPVLLLFLMPGCSTTEKCGQKTAPAVQATEAHVKNAPYRVRGKRYTPMSVADALQYSETGYASWYGGKGRSMKTSSGEYINPQRSMTAAHKTLPMPCKVKVTCRGHGQIGRRQDQQPRPLSQQPPDRPDRVRRKPHRPAQPRRIQGPSGSHFSG